jgi:hypothetical protein
MPITGLPSTQINGNFIDRLTTTAVKKLFAKRIVRDFIQNDSDFNQTLNMSFTKGQTANIRVRPIAGAPQSITDHSASPAVTYEVNSAGIVPVTLDEEIVKGWGMDLAQNAIAEFDYEADLFEVNAEQIANYIESKVVNGLVTSPVTQASVGLTATPLNWNLIKKLRADASAYGVSRDEYLNCFVANDRFQELYDIVQITNKDWITTEGYGANGFEIGQGMNIRFIETNYMNRAPTTLPCLVAYPESTPVGVFITRQLPAGVTSQQKVANYEGISMLYTETYVDYAGSMKKNCKLAVLAGFKTFSGNINAAGVQQLAPIFKALGGI